MVKKSKLERIKLRAELKGFKEGKAKSDEFWQKKVKEIESKSNSQLALFEQNYSEKANRFQRRSKALAKSQTHWTNQADMMRELMGFIKGFMSEHDEIVNSVQRRLGELETMKHKLGNKQAQIYKFIDEVNSDEPVLIR